MKKIFTLIVSLFISYLTFAQVGFNYKALITNNGNPLSNANVNIRFTVLNGGTVMYREVHNGVTTDQHGIVSVNIGEGTPQTGTFSHALYRDFTMQLRVEINTGSGWQNFGQEDFKLVPMAAAAHHLTTTDRVWIGSSTSAGEKLFVKDEPSGPELVEFYLQNTLSGDDVIQLTMDTPASGTAQFIEARNGNNTVFQLHDNGTIFTQGEIQTTVSGSADMKAYVYGYVNSSGNKVTSRSSSGWTVQQISTGKYKITLTGINHSDYMVIVTPYNSYTSTIARIATVDIRNGYFYVDIFNDDGTRFNRSFNFVVFKK